MARVPNFMPLILLTAKDTCLQFTITLTPIDLKDLKATTKRPQNEDKMHDLGTKL